VSTCADEGDDGLEEVVCMTETSYKVVVGVDGSDGSKAALRWAVEEARARGGTVFAVHAWEVPPMAYASFAAVPDLTPHEMEKLGDETARETISSVIGDDVSVPVIVELREGHATRALVEASADADLLVVGTRGRGGFAGLLLGSISTYAVHHATCPVVVVRPGWTPAR
jgi:nucleotide-binding universal stress UspA family protein